MFTWLYFIWNDLVTFYVFICGYFFCIANQYLIRFYNDTVSYSLMFFWYFITYSSNPCSPNIFLFILHAPVITAVARYVAAVFRSVWIILNEYNDKWGFIYSGPIMYKVKLQDVRTRTTVYIVLYFILLLVTISSCFVWWCSFKNETCIFTVKNKYAAILTMVHKNLHCCFRYCPTFHFVKISQSLDS